MSEIQPRDLEKLKEWAKLERCPADQASCCSFPLSTQDTTTGTVVFSFGSPNLRAMFKNQRGSTRKHYDGQGPMSHAQRRQIEGPELIQYGKEQGTLFLNSNLQLSKMELQIFWCNGNKNVAWLFRLNIKSPEVPFKQLL